jgi:hypothetical protein
LAALTRSRAPSKMTLGRGSARGSTDRPRSGAGTAEGVVRCGCGDGDTAGEATVVASETAGGVAADSIVFSRRISRNSAMDARTITIRAAAEANASGDARRAGRF